MKLVFTVSYWWFVFLIHSCPGFWGIRPQTSTGALPRTALGDFRSPDPVVYPPLANSWLRPCFSLSILMEVKTAVHDPLRRF